MKKSRFAGLVAVLVIAMIADCNRGVNISSLLLDNGALLLEFDKNSGALLQLRDQARAYEYIDRTVAGSYPWEITLAPLKNNDNPDLSCAKQFEYAQPDPLTLLLTWKKFPERKNLCVVVTVSLDPQKPL